MGGDSIRANFIMWFFRRFGRFILLSLWPAGVCAKQYLEFYALRSDSNDNQMEEGWGKPPESNSSDWGPEPTNWNTASVTMNVTSNNNESTNNDGPSQQLIESNDNVGFEADNWDPSYDNVKSKKQIVRANTDEELFANKQRHDNSLVELECDKRNDANKRIIEASSTSISHNTRKDASTQTEPGKWIPASSIIDVDQPHENTLNTNPDLTQKPTAEKIKTKPQFSIDIPQSSSYQTSYPPVAWGMARDKSVYSPSRSPTFAFKYLATDFDTNVEHNIIPENSSSGIDSSDTAVKPKTDSTSNQEEKIFDTDAATNFTTKQTSDGGKSEDDQWIRSAVDETVTPAHTQKTEELEPNAPIPDVQWHQDNSSKAKTEAEKPNTTNTIEKNNELENSPNSNSSTVKAMASEKGNENKVIIEKDASKDVFGKQIMEWEKSRFNMTTNTSIDSWIRWSSINNKEPPENSKLVTEEKKPDDSWAHSSKNNQTSDFGWSANTKNSAPVNNDGDWAQKAANFEAELNQKKPFVKTNANEQTSTSSWGAKPDVLSAPVNKDNGFGWESKPDVSSASINKDDGFGWGSKPDVSSANGFGWGSKPDVSSAPVNKDNGFGRGSKPDVSSAPVNKDDGF
ncbi:4710_t:CDS:2, partial [Ambispora gerdemannii]